ncbi:PadR family transcriptional regulator [Flavobacteriales bacterium]|jgi:PadR family transcriptional regulator PadR|nr:PadR family transcriptional regulator [Flavobacteriales bacterium]
MKIENTKSQMKKGILEFCILTIIKRKEVYPSEVIAELKKSELIVVEGTIYPLLTRLKNAEILTYRWQESTSGPPRKYYSITKQGEKFLKELEETWNNIAQSVTNITQS